jgi:hypothetical protein
MKRLEDIGVLLLILVNTQVLEGNLKKLMWIIVIGFEKSLSIFNFQPQKRAM